MQQESPRELVQSWLPRRQADSNKGSYGSVLAAAGSLAYRGAAALCAEGALRGGAGLVPTTQLPKFFRLTVDGVQKVALYGEQTARGASTAPRVR